MSIKIKYIALLCIALALTPAFTSCKKKSEETKNYLSGYLRLGDVPRYVNVNRTLTLAPYGVTHPSNAAMGIYWTLSTVKSTPDTLLYASPKGSQPGPIEVLPNGRYANLVHSFKFADYKQDSVGVFTLTYSVYPVDTDKYYISTSSATIIFVDETLSIPMINVTATPELYDSENHPYLTATIGGDKWISRNLGDALKGGIPYVGSDDMSYLVGRFYTWDEAVKACPEGYALPTMAQCNSLAAAVDNVGDLMIDAAFNNEKMWPYWPEVKISNKTGLALLPMGYSNAPSRKFDGYGKYSCMWTADKDAEGNPLYVYFICNENAMKVGTGDKNSRALPVRCVKIK